LLAHQDSFERALKHKRPSEGGTRELVSL